MSDPDVSVIVCTYADQRWDDLLAAIRSVRLQRVVHDVETVVAVDHNDVLLARLRDAEPGVVAVGNPYARGLSGARNAGLAAARGAVVVFLDDDCVAAPDWLERLLAPYDAPEVAGVGGAAVPRWDARRPRWFPPEFDWVVGCSYRGLPDDSAPVRNFIGANMSFRREALAAAGGFRDGIGRVGRVPLGCEETELCLRLSAAWPGARLVYEPRAVVGHRVPASRGAWRYFAARCWAEGRSKALVAHLAGARRGLSAERHHVSRVLPAGVMADAGDALAGDPAGALRAGAILAGLTIAVLGYVRGALVPEQAAVPPAVEPGEMAAIASSQEPMAAIADVEDPLAGIGTWPLPGR